MSVRPSTRNNSTPTDRIFMKSDIWEFWGGKKAFGKFLFSLKADKKNGYIAWILINFYVNIAEFFREWKISRKKGSRVNQNIHSTGWPKSLCAPNDYNTEVMYTETFWSPCIFSNFFSEYCVVLFGNVEECGSGGQPAGDNPTWHMRSACRITKATLRICNNSCFSSATMVTRTCLNFVLHVHCLYCYQSTNSGIQLGANIDIYILSVVFGPNIRRHPST